MDDHHGDNADEFHKQDPGIEYTPGKCNIGVREIRRRQLVGSIGLFLTISTIFGFYHQHSSRIDRLTTFLPAVVMSIGYLQARKRFCLAFGFSGLFNFGTLGDTTRVISEQDRKLDRDAAIRLFLQALALAAIVTAFVFLLPSSSK
jgi:hypothetical protein